MGKHDTVSVELSGFTVTPKPGETILKSDATTLKALEYAQQDITTAAIKHTAQQIATHPKRAKIRK